ncbi:MAG: c-type cytochrome biogenesis protein CcmI [Betaproteobacteria bacterium HGW-Betaproteobacteria-7]|jgi:cytochrome c-type biogenesis protein CcmH|nr:MAG: c-type cytochrome biogenesis protein CcmI [Betaproteobacteria bacterium HGW-Betaproteobacteria-7]
MSFFVLAAGALLVLALAILMFPLLRKNHAPDQSSERRATNIALMRDQLRELENDRQSGNLSAEAYDQTHREIHRRLLDELPTAEPTANHSSPGASRKTAIAVLLLLPLLAIGSYLYLGSPRALNPVLQVSPEEMTPAKIQQMVEGLQQRLVNEPENAEGWAMLGRSYRSMERLPEAIEAYARAEAGLAENADFLAEYADLLATANGGDLSGKPLRLVKRALEANPDHLIALWLAGTAAFNGKDFANATQFWDRALATVDPTSGDHQVLAENIAEARRLSKVDAEPGKAISGTVSLAPEIAAASQPDETVFVFARPVDGTRFPLAVVKLRVGDLPAKFVLDDSSAMVADKAISGHPEVIVEARLSRTGDAIGRDGDKQSAAQTVKLGDSKLQLRIDRAYVPPTRPAS